MNVLVERSRPPSSKSNKDETDDIFKIENAVQEGQSILKTNKRELDLIESDLNRIHRKILIEN